MLNATALISSVLKSFCKGLLRLQDNCKGGGTHGGEEVSIGMVQVLSVSSHLLVKGFLSVTAYTLSSTSVSFLISSRSGWSWDTILKKVLEHVSAMLSLSGGMFASACKAAIGDVFRAPIAILIAAF